MAHTITLDPDSSANALIGATSATTAAGGIDDIPNKQLLCVVINLCVQGTGPPTAYSLTSPNLTWSLQRVVDQYASSGSLSSSRQHSLYFYTAKNNTGSTISGEQLTFDWGVNGRTIGFAVCHTSPNSGEELEIKQVGTGANGTGSSLSCSLATLSDEANLLVSVFVTGGSATGGITPEDTELTELVNTSIVTTERQVLSVAYQNGSDTTLTATGNGDNWAAFAFEVGPVAASSGQTPRTMHQQRMRRAA